MPDILVITDLFMYTIAKLRLYDGRNTHRSAIDLVYQYGPRR